MKILILTITAGEGHNSTAKAIKGELDSRGVDSKIVDVYKQINKGLFNIVSKGYVITVKDLKGIYSRAYRALEHRKSNSFTNSTSRTTNRVIGKRLHDSILEYEPDVIIYTHVFIGPMLDVIKQRRGLDAKIVGIVTDFVMHPFWEDALRIDYVVTPSEMLIPAARRKGFLPEQILPFGIPIKPKFKESMRKEDARAEVGVSINTPTVLMMSGGMGYGDMEKNLTLLDRVNLDFQIIVVCGNNDQLHAQIGQMLFKHRVLNLGFASNVDLLMDAADFIITKPGGITTSEALAKRLPIVIVNPIPGQEDRNTDFLLNCGAAVLVSEMFSIADAANMILGFPQRAEQMRRAVELIRKPNSTSDLCDFVLSPDFQVKNTELVKTTLM